jgi:hypothetical protein
MFLSVPSYTAMVLSYQLANILLRKLAWDFLVFFASVSPVIMLSNIPKQRGVCPS